MELCLPLSALMERGPLIDRLTVALETRTHTHTHSAGLFKERQQWPSDCDPLSSPHPLFALSAAPYGGGGWCELHLITPLKKRSTLCNVNMSEFSSARSRHPRGQTEWGRGERR